MKLKIFSVYDCKIEAYAPPFFMRTAGEALRAWETTVNQDEETSNIAKHPADYTLFEIGEYDEATGHLHSHSANINLGSALEAKSSLKRQPQLKEA